MTVFKPDENRRQDLGGVYIDGETKQFKEILLDVGYSGQHSESPNCGDVCFVDSMGNPLPKDSEGCWVIDISGAQTYISNVEISGDTFVFTYNNGSELLVSGFATSDFSGVCDYIAANCPSVNDVELSGGVFVFKKQDGTEVEISGFDTTCRFSTISIGKVGTVSADSSVDVVPPFPLTGVGNQTIVDARATLSNSGSTDTEFEIFKSSDTAGPWTSIGAFTFPAGDEFLNLSGLVGEVLPAGGFIANQVTSGSNGEDLNIVIYTEDCDGTSQTTINNSSLAIGGYTLTYDRGDGSSPDVIQLPNVSGVALGTSGTAVYFEMGQGGELVEESDIKNTGRWVVPSGLELYISNAWASLATPSNGQVQVSIYATADPGDGTAPTPGAAVATLTIPSGVVYKKFDTIIGTYMSEYHIQEAVTDVSGVGATDLVVGIFGQLYE